MALIRLSGRRPSLLVNAVKQPTWSFSMGQGLLAGTLLAILTLSPLVDPQSNAYATTTTWNVTMQGTVGSAPVFQREHGS